MSDMKQRDPKSPMAERILLKMEELGYNAKRLSIEAGLNETYVRDLLKSEKPNPRFLHLQALADKLGVSVEWLGNGREQAQSAEIMDLGRARVLKNRQAYAAKNDVKNLAGKSNDKKA